MSKKQHLFIIIVYVIINGIIFWMTHKEYLSMHFSINEGIALMVGGILGVERFFYTFLIYMGLTTPMLYGLGLTVKRKLELVLYVLIAVGASIPILNGNGL